MGPPASASGVRWIAAVPSRGTRHPPVRHQCDLEAPILQNASGGVSLCNSGIPLAFALEPHDDDHVPFQLPALNAFSTSS